MSLNFFTSKPEKTDASLSYNNVLSSVKLNEATPSLPLNIDQFIQSENIQFSRNQEFYNECSSDGKDLPKKIDHSQAYTVQDTRLFINSLIELSNTMPDLKLKTIENADKLESSVVENKRTINLIQSAQQSL